MFSSVRPEEGDSGMGRIKGKEVLSHSFNSIYCALWRCVRPQGCRCERCSVCPQGSSQSRKGEAPWEEAVSNPGVRFVEAEADMSVPL